MATSDGKEKRASYTTQQPKREGTWQPRSIAMGGGMQDQVRLTQQ